MCLNLVFYIPQDDQSVGGKCNSSLCIYTNFNVHLCICEYHYCMYSKNARITDRIKLAMFREEAHCLFSGYIPK